MDGGLSKLTPAANRKDASATMQAANDVSATIADVYTIFNPKVPADLGRLDVLGRQVVLDAAGRSYTAAADMVARAKAVWDRLRPRVLEKNGGSVAEKYTTSLTTQAKAVSARNANGARNEAAKALELVDEMERLF